MFCNLLPWHLYLHKILKFSVTVMWAGKGRIKASTLCAKSVNSNFWYSIVNRVAILKAFTVLRNKPTFLNWRLSIPLCKNTIYIYCPSHTTQCCKVRIMQLTPKLHVSTPWGHLQAYKIWYHSRYVCKCYLRDPVVAFTNVPCTVQHIFYKPEDDPMGSKHVGLVLIA